MSWMSNLGRALGGSGKKRPASLERRNSPRYKMVFAVQVETKEDSFVGTACDLSLTGLGLLLK